MPALAVRYRDRLPIGTGTPLVSLGEGGTPLVHAPRLSEELGLELWLKVEGANPTGSFKDRGMTIAVAKALEAGASAVICASTGNTAASAAAYAARAGLRAVVLVPAGGVPAGKLFQSAAAGARLLEVRGSFDQALAAAQELASGGEFALVNSVNPDRLEGQKTAAFEIVEELGVPDLLALPYGGGGNTTAYVRGFEESGSLPRLIAGEAADRASTAASAIRIAKPAHRRRGDRGHRPQRRHRRLALGRRDPGRLALSRRARGCRRGAVVRSGARGTRPRGAEAAASGPSACSPVTGSRIRSTPSRRSSRSSRMPTQSPRRRDDRGDSRARAGDDGEHRCGIRLRGRRTRALERARAPRRRRRRRPRASRRACVRAPRPRGRVELPFHRQHPSGPRPRLERLDRRPGTRGRSDRRGPGAHGRRAARPRARSGRTRRQSRRGALRRRLPHVGNANRPDRGHDTGHADRSRPGGAWPDRRVQSCAAGRRSPMPTPPSPPDGRRCSAPRSRASRPSSSRLRSTTACTSPTAPSPPLCSAGSASHCPPQPLGATLSGAGPTVIVWARPGERGGCADELRFRFPDEQVLPLTISQTGAGPT